MEPLKWNACLNTGLAKVDEQHCHLFDLINRLSKEVMRPEGAFREGFDAVFSELADYARYHFAEEEALMAEVRVDDRHVTHHIEGHRAFLNEVSRLYGTMSGENLETARSLLNFLTHWLAYHILGSDQSMAKQIAAIKAGQRFGEDSAMDLSAHDPRTDLLLAALNGLFEQVSERNVELVELNRHLEARVADRTQALTEANQRLEDLANTDMLTGLPNRRHAMNCLSKEWVDAVRADLPLACMLIDVDGFKAINDIHGHDAGDAVLRALSRQLLLAVRTDDIVCRLGGDEFLVICARTPLEGALTLAEEIRWQVESLRVPVGSGEWHGSISMGVANRMTDMQGMDSLIKAADLALYAAKRRGRNCVAAAGHSETSPGEPSPHPCLRQPARRLERTPVG